MLQVFRRIWLALGVLVLFPSFLAANGQAEQAPVIQMADQPRQFLAPGNLDAKARTLVLPFSTLTFTAQGQVIKSWTFTVFDSSGRVVSEESRLETRDRGFFGELFNIGPRPQVEVPKELTWDGAYHRPGKPEDGNLVPDGNYTYQITILDSAGSRAQTPPFNATVKNAKVSVDYLRISQTIFSPQGARKTITIEQSGSREYHWEGHFTNEGGRIVRTLVWENPSEVQLRDVSPPTFSWDGKDDQGNIVPDGTYRYALTGFNRAGATLTVDLPQPIQVSERSGVVRLLSDSDVFSPKAVGAPTSLTFFPEVGTTDGLSRWQLRVAPPGNPELPRWTAGGAAPLPEKIVFQGQTTSGLPLPEGPYQAVLSVTYDNGNTAESALLPFTLVLTPPKASLTADATVFGGSGRAGVSLTFQGEPGIPWDLDILDPRGRALRHFSLGSSGAGSVEFQGMDDQGKALADGVMVARVSARNLAGVPGTALLNLRKDSRPMPVSLDLSRSPLVPGKGNAGVVRVTPVLKVVDSIEKTVLTVTKDDGMEVASRSADSILTFWDWNGDGTDRQAVPDGTYQVNLEVDYANGTVSRATTSLKVDARFLDDELPQAELHLSTSVFAPQNVDGPQTLGIDLVAQQGASPLASWNLAILDPRGKPFRTFTGQGPAPAHLVWDGKSDSGVYVESGEEYQVLFQVTDTGGRTAKKEDQVTVDILVDKLADGRYKIVISSIQFSGYSSDVFKVPQPLLGRNLFVLQRLASVLNRLPGYRIGLEGYAVSEFSADPKNAEREQADELIPLSLDRAQEVKTALVLLGVDDSRFAVQGFGALRPLVANTDLENRWKNRRVEFYLEKAKGGTNDR